LRQKESQSICKRFKQLRREHFFLAFAWKCIGALRAFDQKEEEKSSLFFSRFPPIQMEARRIFALVCFKSLLWSAFAKLDVHAEPDKVQLAILASQKACENGLDADFCSVLRRSNASLGEHPVDLFKLYFSWSKSEEMADIAPSEKDVSDVALSLIRLQSVYNLTSLEMSLGKVYHFSNTLGKLNKEECFFIADVAKRALLRSQCVEWFNVCLENYVNYDLERQSRLEEHEMSLKELDKLTEEASKDENGAENAHRRLPMDLAVQVVNKNVSKSDQFEVIQSSNWQFIA